MIRLLMAGMVAVCCFGSVGYAADPCTAARAAVETTAATARKACPNVGAVPKDCGNAMKNLRDAHMAANQACQPKPK